MLPMTSASPPDSHAIIPPSFAIRAAASIIASVDFGLRSMFLLGSVYDSFTLPGCLDYRDSF